MSEAVTRETFWQIGAVGEALFYYLAAVAILVFLYGIYGRFVRYTAGTDDPIARFDELGSRIYTAAAVVVSNRNQFDRDLTAGIMHAFILWGFLTLLIGTTILAIDMDIYRPLTGESFYTGSFFLSYSFVMDLMGLLFVAGVTIAIYRRYVVKNERLWGKHTGYEDDLLVWSLFVLGVGGFLLEAVRILGQGGGPQSFEQASFVGYFLANVLAGVGLSTGGAETIYPFVWWSHALVALWWIAWIPFAKPFHMFSSFANVVTRDGQAGKRLPGVPADAAPEEIGPTDIDDFSWKQLLDHDACTKCGRCSAVCPAKMVGRPLDPRDVILDLKRYRRERDAGGESIPIVADGGTSVVDSAAMESCLSCLACMDACPVEIEHVAQFTEMNRRLTESGEMDEHVQNAMMDVFQHGNTFGEPGRKRSTWTDDLDFEVPDAREKPVDILWYVGDYPSYDDRNQAVARALARLFEFAGVDYGILHEDEKTAGNDVRRVGEEGLYEMLVEDNAAAIGDCEFDRIVCTDPHAYNTFKNEYPTVEACDWESEDVFHYTEFVESLVASGQLDVPETLSETVTFHDPCHLGRYNGEYETPRRLVRATGVDLVEMERTRADSFCCGGGGGGLWTEFEEDEKPSENRLSEAVDGIEGIGRFVVACPMCVTMFEDGRKTGGFEDDVAIVDLTELLVEAIEAENR